MAVNRSTTSGDANNVAKRRFDVELRFANDSERSRRARVYAATKEEAIQAFAARIGHDIESAEIVED
jgi:hypothetical protein